MNRRIDQISNFVKLNRMLVMAALLCVLCASAVTWAQAPSPAGTTLSERSESKGSVELLASEVQVLALLRRDSIAADAEVPKLREAYEQGVRRSVLRNQAFWGEVQRQAAARGLDLTVWGFDAEALRFVKKPKVEESKGQKPEANEKP